VDSPKVRLNEREKCASLRWTQRAEIRDEYRPGV